jgi:hypothetical protein
MGILRKAIGTSIATKAAKAITKAGSKAEATAKAAGDTRPSPNPATNLLLADLALRGGGQILRRAVEFGLLGKAYSPEKAKNLIKGRSMAQTLVGTAIARIATRSVPGALIVGGGLLAKTLYDRKQGRNPKVEGQQAIEDQARRGRR